VDVVDPNLAAVVAACHSWTGIRCSAWIVGKAYTTTCCHYMTPSTPVADEFAMGFGFDAACSYHPGGVNALSADRNVKFISDSIDRRIWWALATRASGEILGEY